METRNITIIFGLAVGILFVVAIIWGIFISAQRLGKIEVVIDVAPADSRITIDDKQSSIGKVYLPPGEHVFVAEKDGFIPDRQVVEVSESNNYVGLLPTPQSEEALKWARDNGIDREAIGGQIANQRGQDIREKYPIIKDLPYAEIGGPFIIRYAFDADDQDHIYITIELSSPDGRQKALRWIKSKGYEPTDYDIRYQEFVNPLTGDRG